MLYLQMLITIFDYLFINLVWHYEGIFELLKTGQNWQFY